MALPDAHRALVLTSRDQPLSVQTVPTPRPGAGSAVIRVLVAGVLSYSGDVYTGKRPYPFPTPMVPGTSAIGRVVAVGPDATRLSEGALVLFDSAICSRDSPDDIILSGIISGFTAHSATLMTGEWRDSSYAEYAKVPLENCTPLDERALLGPGAGSLGYTVNDLAHITPLLVPFGGLDDVGVRPGETVVIAPATGIFGGAAVHVALALGARVIAMGRNADALAALAALCPGRVQTVVIANDAEKDTAALRAAAGGPIDVFFDISPPMAAQSAHIRAGIDVVRRGGRVSLMGGVRDDIAFNYASFMHRNLTLKGTWMCTRQQMHKLIRMVETGVLPIGEKANMQIVGSFGLEEWQRAFEVAAQNAKPGKAVVITP